METFKNILAAIFWIGVVLFIFNSDDKSVDTSTSTTSTLETSIPTTKALPYNPTPASSGYIYENEEAEYYNDEPLTFNGYECTEDCSGHEAGYNWAEENGITDPYDCGGNSNSFIEGCESYAEEYQYEEEEEYYDDSDYYEY